jgi:hypothetical protein
MLASAANRNGSSHHRQQHQEQKQLLCGAAKERLVSSTLPPPNQPTRDSVNEDNVGVMRRRWIAAGKPQYPDWKALMAGLVDD